MEYADSESFFCNVTYALKDRANITLNLWDKLPSDTLEDLSDTAPLGEPDYRRETVAN